MKFIIYVITVVFLKYEIRIKMVNTNFRGPIGKESSDVTKAVDPISERTSIYAPNPPLSIN
jgi:hypothetical protein